MRQEEEEEVVERKMGLFHGSLWTKVVVSYGTSKIGH